MIKIGFSPLFIPEGFLLTALRQFPLLQNFFVRMWRLFCPCLFIILSYFSASGEMCFAIVAFPRYHNLYFAIVVLKTLMPFLLVYYFKVYLKYCYIIGKQWTPGSVLRSALLSVLPLCANT